MMPSNRKTLALVDPRRFRTIQDLTKMRPDCGASIDDFFVIDNKLLLIIDITYMGSILNSYNDPCASYVRIHGVIVHNRVCSQFCSVYWEEPFLLLPLSYHLNDNLMDYKDIGTVVGSISCSSGSLLMLPIRNDIPTPLTGLLDEPLAKEAGAHIKIPNGTYRVFYEQFDVPEGAKKELYQNIAVQKQ